MDNKQLAANIAEKLIDFMTANNKLLNSHLNPQLEYKRWKFWSYEKIERNDDTNFNPLLFRLGAFKETEPDYTFIKICNPGGETVYKAGEKFDIELKQGQEYIFPDSKYNEFEMFASLLLRAVKFIDGLEK